MFGYPPDSPRSLVYHAWVTLSATVVGFVIGAVFGIMLAVPIVHLRTLEKSLLPWVICSQMVPILAIAPIIIVVLGAIGIRGLLPKSIISAYLCFFPVTIGMVKGLISPDPIQLDLMRTWSASKPAGLLEAALAVVHSVPVRQPESLGDDLAGRRHCRRIADRRAGRHRRAAADRILLRADRADLGGAVRRRDHRHRAYRHHRLGRRVDGPAHGSLGMIPRGQAIGFWLTAVALLVALALPLAGDAAVSVTARPPLLAAIVIAAALFAFAPRWPTLSAIFGFAASVLGCGVTLYLLTGDGIAGYAAWGFWLLMLATWLGAALTLTRLAALQPTGRTVRTAAGSAIPLLFGAFLIYLWEVAVRGFGVSPVLMPAAELDRGAVCPVRCRRSARISCRPSSAAC